jgi:hypothetical protein
MNIPKTIQFHKKLDKIFPILWIYVKFRVMFNLFPTFVDIQGVEMLTLIGSLHCVSLINPIDGAGVPRQSLSLSSGPN